jgi:Antitoxin Phd_YefM, type II toxin-antitoxin system
MSPPADVPLGERHPRRRPGRSEGPVSEVADEVGRTHERVHITRNGREYVVLLAAEDLGSTPTSWSSPAPASPGGTARPPRS